MPHALLQRDVPARALEGRPQAVQENIGSRIDAAAPTWIVRGPSGTARSPSGHKKLCKKIARAGGAEAYNAGQKAKEAAAEAVAACAAEVPQDASCHICRMTTGEGLVRGCACRGVTFETAGLAHMSCLVHQAQVAASV